MSATERESESLDIPATLSTQAKSPTLTGDFSDADTLITRDSQYSANTGGRARQSWRNSVSNISSIFRRPSQISKEQTTTTTLSDFSSSRKESSGTTNSSPTDPLLITHTAAPVVPRSPIPVVELPALPVTHPDEPKSFFDSDTESESDLEPILSRASSVRVQKPQVIQNWPTSHGQSPRIYGQALSLSSNLSPSISKVQQILGEQVNNLRLEPITEPSETVRLVESSEPVNDHVKRADTTESNASTMPVAESSNEAMDTFLSLTHTDTERGSVAPQTNELAIHEVAMEKPGAAVSPTTITLSSPLGGFSTGRHARLNGLSINPVRPSDLETSRPHRAISAPLLPHRNLNRKVTIRPSDLVITSATGEHRLFRQSVVSTPYPFVKDIVSTREKNWPNTPVKSVDDDTVDITSATTQATPQSDRFPSPPRAELLTLTILQPSNHSSNTRPKMLQVQIPIPIASKPTFDDEALFHIIRASYNRSLVDFSHRYIFTARILVHASCPADATFDGADFVKLLQCPQEGRKRKPWVVWLRRRQQQDERMPFHESQTDMSSPKVTLYYEFSAVRIALAVLAVLSLSCLATILWVGVGFPRHAGAEGRVLTGFVLGIFVCMLGSLGVGAWVGGSWISR